MLHFCSTQHEDPVAEVLLLTPGWVTGTGIKLGLASTRALHELVCLLPRSSTPACPQNCHCHKIHFIPLQPPKNYRAVLSDGCFLKKSSGANHPVVQEDQEFQWKPTWKEVLKE